MAEHFNALFLITGWAFLVGASGAAFALGVVVICRWMKLAPVNITVTINNPPGTVSSIVASTAESAERP